MALRARGVMHALLNSEASFSRASRASSSSVSAFAGCSAAVIAMVSVFFTEAEGMYRLPVSLLLLGGEIYFRYGEGSK